MAIKAEFEADFSKFNTAVDQATATMKNFESGSARVESSLNRMADSFSGRKLIQDATLMVKAVEDIGGASVLTEKELARVANTAAAAAEKLTAMGQAVPEDLQHYADLAKDAGDASDSLGTRVTGLVEAFHAAQAAMSDAVAIAHEWVAAADEQEAASVRLETALSNQGTATPEVIQQYQAMQKTFEQTTVAADEMVAQMQAVLVTVGKVMPQDMQRAVTAVMDLSAALRIDLPTATTMVAKALEGNTTALHRQGVEVDALALKTEGAKAVFDAIARTMGGAATAQAATFEGQMTRLKNETNNAQESLGKLVESGLKPMLDAFGQLPASMQSGLLVTGQLAKEGAALATGMAGVAASVALALPLLGMTPAGAGAAALSGLATAAGLAESAFIPLAAAIGSIWAAWKIGHEEDIQNAIAAWALSADDLAAKLYRAVTGLQQMTPEQAKAAVAATAAAEAARQQAAALHDSAEAMQQLKGESMSYTAAVAAAKDHVAQLSLSTQAEIVAAKELGGSIKDLATHFHLTEAEINLVIEANNKLTESHRKMQEEQKKRNEEFQSAMESASLVGQGWKSVLDTIDGAIVESAKNYLKAGMSLQELARMYGLAAIQARALVKANEDDAAAEKKREEAAKHAADVEAKALEETTKLWADYDALRAKSSGTTMDQQLADLDKWSEDLQAKMQKIGADTKEFYDALAATYTEKYNQIVGKSGGLADEMSTQTQRGLQQIADKAQNVYEQALKQSGTMSAGAIENLRQIAIAAKVAADMFNSSFTNATTNVDREIQKLMADARATFASIGHGPTDIAAEMKLPKGPSPYETSPIFSNVYTPTAPNINVNVSGVWDSRSINELSGTLGNSLMKQTGRLFPAA